MSGRSWMTTVPPLDSSSVQRLAGSAATAGGATTDGSALGAGADLAAIKANAARGNANRILDIVPPRNRRRLTAAPALTPALTAQPRGDVGGDRRRDELVDRTVIAGDFLDQVRRDRLERYVGH